MTQPERLFLNYACQLYQLILSEEALQVSVKFYMLLFLNDGIYTLR